MNRISSLISFAMVIAGLVALAYIINSLEGGVKKTVTAVSEGASKVFKAVDPTSNENIFYGAANEIVDPTRTGEQTLGTWLAELFNWKTREANAAMKEPAHLNDDVYDPNNPPLYSPF